MFSLLDYFQHRAAEFTEFHRDLALMDIPDTLLLDFLVHGVSQRFNVPDTACNISCA
ncbi:MAG: hypothetical protein FWG84_03000 [Bacteroidales bacterium]|nr:hypothetical protein [Bacteroidales bacterium]